ncbi:hypothetical protein ACN09C_27590 (plasmid) [Serratia fonticola]|jgi:hypothetical protein|uniref:hypothetical protein n=1 Tax=Serratia fonticola TaxID=47917 RepID=UPI003B00931C
MEMEMTVGNLIARLQKDYSPEELCVASVWFEEDFLLRSWGEPLTRDEINAAMIIVDNVDADSGINWSTIEDAVETVVGKANDRKVSSDK